MGYRIVVFNIVVKEQRYLNKIFYIGLTI